MAQQNRFEFIDKAAAFLLGVPLLIGTILLVLALGSPGSHPYRNRETAIPIAIALIVVGVAGGGGYLTWRIRAERADNLEQRANAGAIRLLPAQRTRSLIQISFALADELMLPPGSCIIPLQRDPITAGQLSKALYAAIRRLQSTGAMAVDPLASRVAAGLVVNFARAGSGQLTASTDLNHAIPISSRRKLRSLIVKKGIPLPALTLTPWATGPVLLGSLLITFGTTIPLAQSLEQHHPIDTTDPSSTTLARFIVRGGFFVLLIASAAILGWIARFIVPAFPGRCRTIGHIAARIPQDRHSPSPESIWTAQQVWEELRPIIARAIGVEPHQVQPGTPCQ